MKALLFWILVGGVAAAQSLSVGRAPGVNVRDYDGIAWLFDQVQVVDKVIVYWS